MMRRDILIAAPVVTAALLTPTVGDAGPCAPTTPIRQLYAEWERAHDHSNADGITDEERSRRVDLELEIEERMHAAPVLTVADLATKFLIASGFGVFDVSADFQIEAAALAGISVSRLDGVMA